MSNSSCSANPAIRYELPGGNRIGPATKALAILHLAGTLFFFFAPNFTAEYLLQRNAAIFPGRAWTLLTGVLPTTGIMSLLAALTFVFFLVRVVENNLKCRYFLLLLGMSVLFGSLTCFLTAPASPAGRILFALPGAAAAGAMLHLYRGQRLRLFFFDMPYLTAIIVVMLLILLPFLLTGDLPSILGHLTAFGAGYLLVRLFEKIDEHHHTAGPDETGRHVRHLELD